jgi:uncharacterized protein YbjT (DUF2867 family)
MAKILVTGSTGHVGSRLVPLLASRGHAVRAMVRSGEKASFGDKVEVVTGDFADAASLRKALDGVSHLYLLSPCVGDDFEKTVIEVATSAKLDLLVKHSVAGAQYKATDFTRWHGGGEERIKASGVPYTFLRPAPFATNAFGWAATVKSDGVVYGALGETALPVIDPGDIADVAAAVLTTPGHAGKAYELTGPAAVTSAEQVETLGSVLGRPLKYVNVPDEAMRDSMLKMGMPEIYVTAMVGLVQLLRSFGRIEPTSDVATLAGHPARSFRQWAEANQAAFR